MPMLPMPYAPLVDLLYAPMLQYDFLYSSGFGFSFFLLNRRFPLFPPLFVSPLRLRYPFCGILFNIDTLFFRFLLVHIWLPFFCTYLYPYLLPFHWAVPDPVLHQEFWVYAADGQDGTVYYVDQLCRNLNLEGCIQDVYHTPNQRATGSYTTRYTHNTRAGTLHAHGLTTAHLLDDEGTRGTGRVWTAS
ncbi:hypothetical protein B0H14DRAFT_870352 [Mycena olivaceomarginata]|nr:hypothetical protein B0H14DRAFT_870352 [Mycena olivaceomarginata]